MKIRLMGLPDEIEAATEALRGVLDVVEESKPYPNRGNSRAVRVYVEARAGAAPAAEPVVDQVVADERDQLAEQLRRIRNVEAWIRQRANALRVKSENAPATQARKALADRAHELGRIADDLARILNAPIEEDS